MYQIDNSSAVTTQPARSSSGVNPDAFFSDTGAGGTIVPAEFLNAQMMELINVLSSAGITPNKQDDTQLAQAIIALIAANTPFLRYAKFQDQKASGVDGGDFTSGSYLTRDLNTEVTNNISGASLASNQITLKAGTYQILASAPSKHTNENKARLRNITDAQTLILGENDDNDVDGDMSRSIVSGQFTITGTKVIELQHRCTDTQTVYGFGQPCGFGDNEVYSTVEIWKIA